MVLSLLVSLTAKQFKCRGGPVGLNYGWTSQVATVHLDTISDNLTGYSNGCATSALGVNFEQDKDPMILDHLFQQVQPDTVDTEYLPLRTKLTA